MNRHLVLALLATGSPLVAEVPQSVEALWADFDPRRDPLEIEVVREWTEDGNVFRHVRFLVGTFRGEPARLAAFYGFPGGEPKNLPAVLHMHGGGQRAFLQEVKTYVARGYAALSVNWGGREMEDSRPGDPNTDWGAVDPTQQNVPGYFNLLPGDGFLVDHESPKNCNWYLLTLACRRGLTFLEQQPEVDPRRLGIYGHSMGGNLTMYVAGTDSRVKVAAPSVGGQGWRTEPHPLLQGVSLVRSVTGDRDLYTRTMGFEHYAPRIRCPTLHLSGTNDFHGWMDDVYRTNALIQAPVRYAFSPHLNHRFIPEVAITQPLWLDHYLQDGAPLPPTPQVEWEFATPDHVPLLRVRPSMESLPVTRVEVHYSVDPDPRARFWRDGRARRQGELWEANLPILDPNQPLYAFANVYHELPQPESLPHLPHITEVCLSSQLLHASPGHLRTAQVRPTDQPSLLIDDFSRGWRDWYRLNENHPSLWQFWTRKVTDPKWQGPPRARLEIELTVTEDNSLTLVAIENEWRSYRGKRRTFLCRREIAGRSTPQTIILSTADFLDEDGAALEKWSELDQLGICARYGPAAEPDNWKGPQPQLHALRWHPRP